MTGSWRVSQIASEAVQNLLAAPLRAAITSTLFAAIFGGLAFMDLRVTEDVLNLRAELDARGARAVVATAEGGLTASRCDALRGVSGISAAGGVRHGDPVTLRSAPRVRFQSGAVTAGILEVWDPTYAGDYGAGFVAGDSFAQEVAARPGTVVVLSDLTLDRIGVVLNVQDRNPAAGRWLMEVMPPVGRISECWVEFSPGSLDRAVSLLGAWFEEEASQLVVQRLIPTDQFMRDPARELAERPQAEAWLPLGLVVGLVMSLLIWLRRSEAGLYAALGIRAPGLVLMAQVEATAMIALGWFVGLVWAVALTGATASDVGTDQVIVALRSSASAGLVGLLVTPVALLPILRSPITDLLRDR